MQPNPPSSSIGHHAAEATAAAAAAAAQHDQAVKELVIELRNRAARLSLRVDQIVLTAISSSTSPALEQASGADPGSTMPSLSAQDDPANAPWPHVVIYGASQPTINFTTSPVLDPSQNPPHTHYYHPVQPPSKRAREVALNATSAADPRNQLDPAVFQFPTPQVLSIPHLHPHPQASALHHLGPSQGQLQHIHPSQPHAYATPHPSTLHPAHPYYQAQYYQHPHDPSAAAAAAVAAHHRENMFWSTVLGAGGGHRISVPATVGEHAVSPSIQARALSTSQTPMLMGTSEIGLARQKEPPVEVGTSSSQQEAGHDSPLLGPKVSAYACDQCASTFGQRSNLTKHIKTVHQGLRPFECTQCQATFGHKNLLNEHISTQHLGERPFVCDECGASFGRKSNLYQHSILVHQQRRCFECEVCKVSFGLKGNLNKHIRVVHNKERPFQCDICGASFGLKSDLKRHRSSVHSNTSQGDQAGPMQSAISVSLGSSTSDAPSQHLPSESEEMREFHSISMDEQEDVEHGQLRTESATTRPTPANRKKT